MTLSRTTRGRQLRADWRRWRFCGQTHRPSVRSHRPRCTPSCDAAVTSALFVCLEPIYSVTEPDSTAQSTRDSGHDSRRAVARFHSRAPVASQRAIADYLDRETARIDALVAAKQRMVEFWRKRRRCIELDRPNVHPPPEFADGSVHRGWQAGAFARMEAGHFSCGFTSYSGLEIGGFLLCGRLKSKGRSRIGPQTRYSLSNAGA